MWKTSLKTKITKDHLKFCTSTKFIETIIEKQDLDSLFKIPHTRYLYCPINHDLFNYVGQIKPNNGDLAITNTPEFDGLKIGKASNTRLLTSQEIKALGLPKITSIDNYFNFTHEGKMVEFIIPNEVDSKGKFVCDGKEIPNEIIMEGEYGYILELLSTGRCRFDIKSA
jgi:hypothetical protein